MLKKRSTTESFRNAIMIRYAVEAAPFKIMDIVDVENGSERNLRLIAMVRTEL